jgi:hypothetical protein
MGAVLGPPRLSVRRPRHDSVRYYRARNPERELDCELTRLTAGRAPTSRLPLGLRCGVVNTATLRDATGWDQLV